jgi:hypothetical protein
MLGNLQRTAGLWFREKTGLTASFFILLFVALAAAIAAFVFLCVSGYAWAAAELGPVFGGLATAGVFLAIAVCSFAASALSRSKARQQAIVERAARSRGAYTLMDPKTLRVAMEAGRNVGWQRLISIALLGFLATQLAQKRPVERSDSGPI